MNILHVSSNYPPAIGGPASTVPYLVKELENNNYDCNVISRQKLPMPYSTRRHAGLNTLLMYKKIQNMHPNLIHCHDINVSAGSTILARMKCPKVAKVTGHLNIELMQNKYADKLQRFICSKFDTIIAPSNFMFKELDEMGIHHVEVLNNGVNRWKLQPARNELIREKILEDDEQLIVSACRMVSWKGIDNLIKAVENLNVKLVLIGDGPEKDRLEKTTGDKILWMGRRPHDYVKIFMEAADIYVIPSLWENYPVAALDCMSVGTPIVATAVGGVTEILNKNTANLISPGDVNEIEQSIRQLLLNKQRRESMIKKQKKEIERYYWDNIVKEYIEFYNNVCER